MIQPISIKSITLRKTVVSCEVVVKLIEQINYIEVK